MRAAIEKMCSIRKWHFVVNIAQILSRNLFYNIFFRRSMIATGPTSTPTFCAQ